MSAPSGGDRATAANGRGLTRPIPAVVDWLVAAVVVLSGLLSLVGASALAFLVDRRLLVDAAARGDLQFEGVSEADGIEILLSVRTWTAAGLFVLGAATVLVAAAYLVLVRRARRRSAAGGPPRSYVLTAVLGAVASALLSFLPFSPAIGGAAAGYLEHGASGRTTATGALSGLLATAPLVLLGAFVLGGLVAGLLDVGASGLAVVAGTALLVALAVVATVGAGLGAAGGYAGGLVAADDEE